MLRLNDEVQVLGVYMVAWILVKVDGYILRRVYWLVGWFPVVHEWSIAPKMNDK